MGVAPLDDLVKRLRGAQSAEDVDAIAEEWRRTSPGPEVEALVALAHDVAAARERLASTIRSREVLLASVSHDLRNPLNTFAMSAGLLRDDLDRGDVDAGRALSLVTRMERALTRMQALIEDLLEASRIDARKIDYAIRSESAASIVGDAVKAAIGAFDRPPTVQADSVDPNAKAMCDRARTIQILVKMVVYVSKATGEGGSIRISAAPNDATTEFVVRGFSPGGQPVAPPEEGRGGLALLMARGLAEGQRGTFRIEPGTALALTLGLPSS